ncbi:hypothetical protein ACL02R_10635 [Streptomyces sp. MS19]
MPYGEPGADGDLLERVHDLHAPGDQPFEIRPHIVLRPVGDPGVLLLTQT